jgi:hypothetical protein
VAEENAPEQRRPHKIFPEKLWTTGIVSAGGMLRALASAGSGSPEARSEEWLDMAASILSILIRS